MSRRTQLKIKNARNFLSRYVFNGRYIIRNLIAATLVVSFMVLVMGLVAIVRGDSSDDEATDALVASDENVTDKNTIICASAAQMDNTKLDKLKLDLQNDNVAEVEPVQTTMVTESKYADRFISIESGINIRSGAGTDYEAIGYLDKGMVGQYLGSEGEWSNIMLGDLCGYVKSEFLLTGEEAEQFANANSFSMETLTYFQSAQTTSDTSVQTSTVEQQVLQSTDPSTEDTDTTQETSQTETDETQTAGDGRVDVPTEYRAAISLSESDINLIASVVALESGSESYEGQLAVANVIINRYLSGVWGSTISDVLYAPNQFSVVNTTRFENYLANGASGTPLQATLDALAGKNNIGSYKSFRPTYFLNSTSFSNYTVIGNHLFF